MNLELITTSDGSHSLKNLDLNETYHSVHGSVQESMHVFIESGLRQHPAKNLNILEAGFGTGLNAFLSRIEAEKTQRSIFYTAIELYPLDSEIYQQLNYPVLLNQDPEEFLKLHECPWGSLCRLSGRFSFKKIKVDLTDYQPSAGFDLIYFDAFSPSVQPELWTFDIFKKLETSMNTGAMLVTYASAGFVRRNMQEAGLKTEKIPGPPGKREMLRGFKL